MKCKQQIGIVDAELFLYCNDYWTSCLYTVVKMDASFEFYTVPVSTPSIKDLVSIIIVYPLLAF